MSKLRDRIRDMSRRRTATFGFTAVRTARAPGPPAPRRGGSGGCGRRNRRHRGGSGRAAARRCRSKASRAWSLLAGSTPVGQLLEAATADSAAAVIEAGAHFLVFNDQQTEAAALLKPALGYVAIVDPTDSELRLLRPLDLDAVIVLQPAAEFSVREQLRLRRTSELVRKPLIARLEGAVSATTLEVLARRRYRRGARRRRQ